MSLALQHTIDLSHCCVSLNGVGGLVAHAFAPMESLLLPPAGNGTYHFKILVPAVAAGAIIGKGGETIALLQKEAGARVKMSKSNDFYPGEDIWPLGLASGGLLTPQQKCHIFLLFLVSRIFCVSFTPLFWFDKTVEMQDASLYRFHFFVRSTWQNCIDKPRDLCGATHL